MQRPVRVTPVLLGLIIAVYIVMVARGVSPFDPDTDVLLVASVLGSTFSHPPAGATPASTTARWRRAMLAEHHAALVDCSHDPDRRRGAVG